MGTMETLPQLRKLGKPPPHGTSRRLAYAQAKNYVTARGSDVIKERAVCGLAVPRGRRVRHSAR